MRVGIIGTGAISNKHAQVYRNIGYELIVCTDIYEEAGRKFAERWGCEFVPTMEEVCRHPKVDYVDLCTFPDYRLEPVEACAAAGKSIQVQKPMAINLETAGKMIEVASKAGITGTPGFVIALTDPKDPTKAKGVKFLRGAQPFNRFKIDIDKALADN